MYCKSNSATPLIGGGNIHYNLPLNLYHYAYTSDSNTFATIEWHSLLEGCLFTKTCFCYNWMTLIRDICLPTDYYIFHEKRGEVK